MSDRENLIILDEDDSHCSSSNSNNSSKPPDPAQPNIAASDSGRTSRRTTSTIPDYEINRLSPNPKNEYEILLEQSALLIEDGVLCRETGVTKYYQVNNGTN
jgi:hypothetical protein